MVAESRWMPTVKCPHSPGSALAGASVRVKSCRLVVPAPAPVPVLPRVVELVGAQE